MTHVIFRGLVRRSTIVLITGLLTWLVGGGGIRRLVNNIQWAGDRRPGDAAGNGRAARRHRPAPVVRRFAGTVSPLSGRTWSGRR